MLKPKILKDQQGLGLVEVIFALGVSILVTTSLVSLGVFTLRSSLQSKLMLQGSKVTNQEIELVRAYRDSAPSWEGFIDDINACDTSNCSIASNLSSIDTSAKCYVRGAVVSCSSSDNEKVTIYFNATETDGSNISGYPNVIRISVVTSWQVGGQTKYLHNYTELSNWRGR